MNTTQKMQMLALTLAMLAGLTLSGCGSKPAAKLKVYWPPPPNEPKMEWLTTFDSEDDFPKTEGELAAEKFLGKQQQTFFRKPMGVAADSRGLVYVADLDEGNIRILDFDRRTMSLYSEEATIGLPIGLAVDRQDNLYVADALSKQVLVFDARKQPQRAYGAGELERPAYLALDEARGRLYVTDPAKNEAVVFDLASGDKLFAIGGPGNAAGQLFGPQGIAIDKEGRVFVAEQLNTRIQVFDPDGKHLYMFGTRGDKPFMFEGPRGLAFDSAGNLFVVETRKAALLIFQPDGTPLTSVGGSRGEHPLSFTLPVDVFIDHSDRVYISDGLNRRITIWQMLTPAYLAAHPLDTGSLEKIEQRVRQLEKQK